MAQHVEDVKGRWSAPRRGSQQAITDLAEAQAAIYLNGVFVQAK
jgi:hypothetical protein